jgi:hypothetical protein
MKKVESPSVFGLEKTVTFFSYQCKEKISSSPLFYVPIYTYILNNQAMDNDISNLDNIDDTRRKFLITAVHTIQQLHDFPEEIVYQMTLEVNQFLDEDLLLKNCGVEIPIQSKSVYPVMKNNSLKERPSLCISISLAYLILPFMFILSCLYLFLDINCTGFYLSWRL